jgi:hypothetical protein
MAALCWISDGRSPIRGGFVVADIAISASWHGTYLSTVFLSSLLMIGFTHLFQFIYGGWIITDHK